MGERWTSESLVRSFSLGVVRRWAAFVLTALAIGASVSAAPQIGRAYAVGEMRVYVDHFIGPQASRGFAPVTWTVTNEGLDRRRLRIRLKSSYASDMAGSLQEVEVELEAGEARTLEMLVPLDREEGRASLRASLESGPESVAMGLQVMEDRPVSDGRVIGLVASSRVPKADLLGIETVLPLDSGETVVGVFDLGTRNSWQSGEQAAEVFTAGFDELPQRVAGWSAADTVFVYVDGRLPALDEWSRLVGWARQGGQLVFIGGQLNERLARIESLRPWNSSRHAQALSVGGAPDEMRARLISAGFGVIAMVDLGSDTAGPMASVAGPWLVPVMQALDAADGPLPEVFRPLPGPLARAYRATDEDFGNARPWTTVFPSDQLPILPILGLLTVFSILVGPVNVLWSRRRRRPGQLLYAVPIISIVATIVVVTFGVLRQGFDTEGYVHSLSILDQEERLATNLMRRELILGRGGQTLRPLAGTTVLVPDHRAEGELRVTEDDGRELSLSGDFLPVRARTDHLVLANATTRARLEWEAPRDGKMRVTNALGVDLMGLEVMSPTGEIFGATGAIASGASIELTRRQTSDLAGRFGEGMPDPLFERAKLSRATFLAEAKGPGPGADDCSVEMDDLYAVHGIVGLLPTEDERWNQ